MAAYISFQPTDFFSPTLYTGTGAENAITGVGFQPDVSWLKSRSAIKNHYLYDTVRGATKNLAPNDTDIEATTAQGLKSWQSDGFTLGTSGGENGSTITYVSWNWKAGTTSGLSAGTHSVNSYSYNATSGFGIYQYTGDNTAGTITHGLGAVPKMIITKTLGSAVDWFVYHQSNGAGKYMVLNGTASVGSSTIVWGNTTPTSTVFSLGAGAETNTSPREYVAYVFADVKGYSKFGTYTGNGSTDGQFINTGFRPAYVLIKKTNGVGSWWVFDNKRLGYNAKNSRVYANDNTAESAVTNIDFVSNGFKLRTTVGDLNGAGNTIIYAAFAEFPIVSSNSKAGTAR